MGRAKNGQAIYGQRRTRSERRRLEQLLRKAKKQGDLATWCRAKSVLEYLRGKTVIDLSEQLDVTRGSINRWLQWFQAQGTEGLKTKKRPGGEARLTVQQYEELISIIEGGPQAIGFATGIWTGPMIGELIRRHFGVTYHSHYIPRLLHKLGFSVQRPRRRLARADIERQAVWIKKTFPAIKKKLHPVGVLSSLKTRPVSGSMVPFTKRGPGSDNSHLLIPTENERPPTSSVQ